MRRRRRSKRLIERSGTVRRRAPIRGNVDDRVARGEEKGCRKEESERNSHVERGEDWAVEQRV